jgi:hypothetical protein
MRKLHAIQAQDEVLPKFIKSRGWSVGQEAFRLADFFCHL